LKSGRFLQFFGDTYGDTSYRIQVQFGAIGCSRMSVCK
jgi:hypothetical protein